MILLWIILVHISICMLVRKVQILSGSLASTKFRCPTNPLRGSPISFTSISLIDNFDPVIWISRVDIARILWPVVPRGSYGADTLDIILYTRELFIIILSYIYIYILLEMNYHTFEVTLVTKYAVKKWEQYLLLHKWKHKILTSNDYSRDCLGYTAALSEIAFLY